jgi:putative ABC transport system permease protein
VLSYVRRDLVRNPRRTVASIVGVTLGVGLFSGVLFFIDGSGASMTKRAVAPLALDMQVVLNAPLGGGLRLDEQYRAGRFVLTVKNQGSAPANEVVVADEPSPPLSYTHDSATLNGKALPDVGGRSPLSQGLAGTGFNLGTVGPGATVTLTYAVRTAGARAPPQMQGRISSRENVVPAPANAPPPITLPQLRARLSSIPGVAAVDGLAFVDLPPGSLRAGGATAKDTVRLFAFDGGYQKHYPSIRVVSGGMRPGSALLSAEAARHVARGAGGIVELTIPGRRTPLTLPASGIADLSTAKPLFYSRKSNKLEEFLYVPDSVVVSPATFDSIAIPAYRAATATRGSALKSLPLAEADVLVKRSGLRSDPATALAQTKAIAAAVGRSAPGQVYLIDNISNTLQVARDDARIGKRMFLFLGLPGALLAAFLAAYTAGVLASTQRREQANLRIRGAHRSHLMRMLAYRTLAFAGAGALLGTAIGLLSVLVILGGSTLFEASAGSLVVSALGAIGFGMLITAFALYIPARRSLSREITQERGEMALTPEPAWRRLRLDFVLLAAAGVAEVLAIRGGAFDAPPGSVYSGQAVTLPSYLLLAPVVAWFGGILLSVRTFQAVTSRLPIPNPPRFGPVVRGILLRSLRRRSWVPASGTVGVGLVVAFGAGLAMFTSTYDASKAGDARFTVGSDVRATPSVLSPKVHPPSYASKLRVPGVAAVTPVVSKLENSVLIGPNNEDRKNLTAIDPAGYQRTAGLSDSFFVSRSAVDAMAALKADRQGILVQQSSAESLSIKAGDRVQVLLARGTKQQALRTFRVVGIFKRLPGFPQGTDVVANLSAYVAATRSNQADFFLARATDPSHAGLARVAAALRAGPGAADPLNIETSATALNKDQSSLTALNVHGLLDLNSLYTLLMTAAAVAIFVFGLMLQRRREYIALRARGLHARELQALVLGEAALVGLSGLAAGLLVGTGLAYLMVHILRPLFILDPSLTFPVSEIVTLGALALAAALLSALAATAILRRLSPTEILRET